METCSVLASLSATNPRDVSKDGFAASVSDGGMNLCRIWQGKPCLERSLLRHPVPPSWPCLAQRRQLRRKPSTDASTSCARAQTSPRQRRDFFWQEIKAPKTNWFSHAQMICFRGALLHTLTITHYHTMGRFPPLLDLLANRASKNQL